MKKMLPILALALTAATAGCARQADIEKVPVGSKVEVTRQDGGVVRGTLAARDEKLVTIKTASATRTVSLDQIVAARAMDGKPAALPAAAKFLDLTIPEGTRLAASLKTTAGSETSRVGDPVEADLTQPIVIDGTEVLPAGSVASGEVAAVRSAKEGRSRAFLTLHFSSVLVTASREPYPIDARAGVMAPETKSNDAAKIALPAAGGVILGGLLGGGKGAVIGGVIGAGAGTAVVLTSHGPEVRLSRGTVVSLPLERAVDVRVPIARQ